ncbi:RNA-binding domain-containing protein [Stakelama saccharophila]|uniref:ATP-binding protein n=1 Tax=Stakelama saccharophila TaxID=3075605 RepID=A0ABZ0BB30_9SPHN|nr:RNA-binding domain-containing protein [Stakelama sp. W311]WNO54636.1 ATP-binding protein [Stakelama sp. W311]
MQEITQLNREQVLALASRNEDDFFDRKSKLSKGKTAQKLAVAFANTEGGEIAFGIKDSSEESDAKKRIDLFENQEEANGILHALYEINPAINFRYTFFSVEDEEGVLLRVFIDKTQHVHAVADGTVYRRVGASSLPVKNPADITQLAFAKGAVSFENNKLNGQRPELIVDSNETKDLMSGIAEAPDGLSFCVNEGLVDRSDWVPVVAGALLLSDQPQGSIPTRCECRIVFYDTRNDEPEREHLKINETIGGPLYRQINSVVGRVSDILSNISILTPEGFSKVDYPPEAIWEIITNAIIHRDYSISDDIQIIIYQNRIEILSPGSLPAFVNVDNILDVRYSRNPKIVRTLRRYPNPPNQDLGEGLNTAYQKMKDRRLKPPTIEVLDNHVKVTIAHAPLATPEEAVMEYMKANDQITNRQARELTGIKSENQMKEVLYRLRDREFIRRHPDLKGNKAAWIKK